MLTSDLKKTIREIPDFPKPGINFYDVSTLFRDAEAFKTAKGGAMPYAKAFAKEKFDGMERKDVSMRYGQQGHVYTMGEIYTNEEKSFSSGTCDV